MDSKHGITLNIRLLYEKAIEIDPECYSGHFNLGNIYDYFEDYRNALKHFRHTLEINPDYADVYFNMAIVYEKIGLINKAMRNWKEYLKIDPQSEYAELVREHLENEIYRSQKP